MYVLLLLLFSSLVFSMLFNFFFASVDGAKVIQYCICYTTLFYSCLRICLFLPPLIYSTSFPFLTLKERKGK